MRKYDVNQINSSFLPHEARVLHEKIKFVDEKSLEIIFLRHDKSILLGIFSNDFDFFTHLSPAVLRICHTKTTNRACQKHMKLKYRFVPAHVLATNQMMTFESKILNI